MPMIGARFYTQLDASQMRNDVIEEDLAKVCEGAFLQSVGVSQSRVRLLGSTCLPSILLQKRVKNTSWHSENEVWNTLASVQVCVI